MIIKDLWESAVQRNFSLQFIDCFEIISNNWKSIQVRNLQLSWISGLAKRFDIHIFG